MGANLAEFDWSESEVGEPEDWSPSFRTAMGIVLGSEEAMLLLWGPNLLMFYNDAYLPLLGTKFANVVGRPFKSFRPDIWPSVQALAESAMRGEGKSVHDMRVATERNGVEEVVYATVAYAPVYVDNDHIGGVLATIQENTAQVRSRQLLARQNRRFQELFRQAPGFLAIGRTSDYRFEFVNDAYEELVGRRGLAGKEVAVALPEAEAQGFMELLREVERTGQPFIAKNMLFSVETSPGVVEEKFLDFIYQPIADQATGEVTGILCAGNDVTQEHLAREKAERLATEMMHFSRNDAMGTMANTLAHELNQPLTAATNYLNGALRVAKRPEGQADAGLLVEALEQVHQQITRAGEIIRRARQLVAREGPTRQTAEVARIVDEAIALTRATYPSSSISIETNVDADAEFVDVDAIQIEQVLVNLLKNACTATELSSGTGINVSASRTPFGEVEFRVSDTGGGVEQDNLATIFEAFGRSTTGGMGIGLSLSRTIVEAHGGRIWAANNPGGGATFGFTVSAKR